MAEVVAQEPYECVSSQLRSEWELRKRMKEERELRKAEKQRLRVPFLTCRLADVEAKVAMHWTGS